MDRRPEHRERDSGYLAAIVDSSDDAIISKDLNSVVTSWNPAAERIFGYSSDEMVGQSIVRMILPDHREEEVHILDAVRRGDRIEHLVTQRIRKDGSLLDVSLMVSPIRDRQKKLIGVSTIVRDITELKLSEDRFRMVVESSPSALLLIDSEGRIQLVNNRAEDLFGHPRKALLGQPIEVLIPERFRPAHPGMITDFFDPEGRPMGAGRDLFGLRHDGKEVPVEIRLNPFVTSVDHFTLASVIDITERKNAERELHDRTEELLRSNQDLEQFAYAASHDLQEPLRAVSGCVQMLQQRYKEKLDDRAGELISMAVDGTVRMQALIEDLLTYSRLGRRADELCSVSCAEGLDAALKNLFVVIQETSAEVSQTELPHVWGNPAQLVMLFQNLVGNAIKFRSKDVPPRVHVGAEQEGAFWKISVADNGIGIEPQYFQRIFAIFQRLHSRREYPGTGIGLALCKRIVEHHGGEIQVESEVGRGTTIHFTLKAVSDSEQTSGVQSESR